MKNPHQKGLIPTTEEDTMKRRMIQLALCIGGGLVLTLTADAADVDDVKSASEG